MWFFGNKDISEANIRDILKKNGVLENQILSVKIEKNDVKIIIDASLIDDSRNVQKEIEDNLAKKVRGRKIFVVMTSNRPFDKMGEVLGNDNIRKNIKKVIAVASGKGGVGKSTVAINIACALSKQGLKVGLMDADIYGPSVPKLAGISEKKPEKGDEKLMKPLEEFGIKFMSMGFLIEENNAVIWKGPKIQGAVIQMVRDVEWGELDVLVVDTPPGTGDVPLTLSQKIGIDGVVMVSTPQDIAMIDTKKAIDLFEKLEVPILGIIENMSIYICPECGHEEHIFGSYGVKNEAKERNIPLLAEIPLEMVVRLLSDEGIPIVTQKPDSKAGQEYLKAADKIEHILFPE